MKNSDVLQLNNKLNFYSKELRNLKGAKFSYGIIKNTNILQKECKDIVAVVTTTDEYKAYDTKRLELCEKFARRDDKGEIVKINQKENGTYDYDININDPLWIEAIETLKTENKSVIEEQDKKIDEYNAFLDAESAVEFHKIDINDVPDDINVELMSIIEVFIK